MKPLILLPPPLLLLLLLLPQQMSFANLFRHTVKDNVPRGSSAVGEDTGGTIAGCVLKRFQRDGRANNMAFSPLCQRKGHVESETTSTQPGSPPLYLSASHRTSSRLPSLPPSFHSLSPFPLSSV